MNWRSCLAALCLIAFGDAAAAAELKHTTVYDDHLVHGTTARELWQDMKAHPIIDPDDGPAYANITHDHTLTFKTAIMDGHCQVTNLTFAWNFVITLPRAANYAGMDGATKKTWQQFTGYLKSHEEHHEAIFLDCGKNFVPAAEKITGPAGCTGVDKKVRAFVDRQYAACMTKQRDFDRGERATVAGLALIQAAHQAKIPIGGGL